MGAEAERRPEKEEKPTGVATSATITEAQFLSWKHRKDADALAKRAEAARKRDEDIAAGTVQMNGRELFQHEPWVFDNNLY